MSATGITGVSYQNTRPRPPVQARSATAPGGYWVGTVGWAIHWMGKTYGADQPIGQCVALASFTATPLFLVGALAVYPVLWVNLVAGLPVLAFTTYIFYSGVPVMMEVPPERGFLFSSAMLAFGLVTFVALLAVTVLLWGTGYAPAFVS